jgi:hypothetical protein
MKCPSGTAVSVAARAFHRFSEKIPGKNLEYFRGGFSSDFSLLHKEKTVREDPRKVLTVLAERHATNSERRR